MELIWCPRGELRTNHTPRAGVAETIGHPSVGSVAVDCDVLSDGDSELEIVIMTAVLGSADETKLRLAAIGGPPASSTSEPFVPVWDRARAGTSIRRIISIPAHTEKFSISENTVEFHVANVLSKLGVNSRNQAALLARDAGIGVE